MEHLMITIFEHKYLQKHKLSLEAEYNIKINLPDIDKSAVFCSSDVIFASIRGEEKNIETVKNLMKEQSAQDRCVAVITLSDSDTPVLSESQNRVRKKRRRRSFSATSPKCAAQASSTAQHTNHGAHPGGVKSSSLSPAEVFIPLSLPCKRKKSRTNRPPQRTNHVVPCVSATPQQSVDDSIIVIQDDAMQEDLLLGNDGNDSVILLEDDPVVLRTSPPANDSIVLLEEKPVVVPRPLQPRVLRPIVIDGNNVAREHGKIDSTYSCRGIQLAVEFFLCRGHMQVTAFVPNFRRYKVHGPFPTTHPEILEEMAKSQRVAFTPSRNLNGKRLTCYDDRFIVELASTTEGVILSNDNYRDIVGESEAFRKTIEERLLMYCFVGDKLMIPQDPLGRDGPKLDTYLSLPPPLPEGTTDSTLPPITLI